MPTDRNPQRTAAFAPSASAAVTLAPPPRAPGARRGDPRIAELRAAAAWLRHEMDLHRVAPPDRGAAEAELLALERRVASGELTVPALRGSLLALAGALGSVSALAAPFSAFHRAVEVFGR